MEMATDPLRAKEKVGYRFHPHDHELVGYFLTRKRHRLSNKDDTIIAEVEIYNKEPWDLPDLSPNISGDDVWYFYCKPVRKYKNSRRSNRTTEAGYWKSTGKPRIVRDKKFKKMIGTKKTLVFHKGRPKGVSTEWVMHEYECSSSPKMHFEDDYVLYKLKKSNNKTAEEKPKGCLAATSDSQNQILNEMTPISASAYRESELAYGVASNFENQNHEEVNASATLERRESSCTKNSESEHQNPDEIISISDLGAWSPSNMMSFDEEGEPAGLMASDFDNPISFPTEGGWNLPPAAPSAFQNQSTCVMLSDFENENTALPLKKQSDVSEYEIDANQVVLPSDGCLQNQYKNSDSSSFEGGHQGSLMAPSFQNQRSSEIVDFGIDKPKKIIDGQGLSMTLPPDCEFNNQSGAPKVGDDFWSSLLDTLGSDSTSGGMPGSLVLTAYF